METTNDRYCIVYDDMISMKCFGVNNSGQLGQGDMMHRGGTPTTMIPFIPKIDLGTALETMILASWQLVRLL